MNNVDKFKRHMRKPIEVEVINKDGVADKFNITPLTNIDLIGFLNLCSDFSEHFKKAKDIGQKKKALQDMPIEVWNSLFKYMRKSIKPSYPDVSEDVLDNFISSNFLQLYPEISKLNIEINTNKIPTEILKKIKETQTNETK